MIFWKVDVIRVVQIFKGLLRIIFLTEFNEGFSAAFGLSDNFVITYAKWQFIAVWHLSGAVYFKSAISASISDKVVWASIF